MLLHRWEGADSPPPTESVPTESAPTETHPAETEVRPSPSQPEMPEEDEPSQQPEPYVSPIDFDALQQENPHIYAWLRIPGTHIDYPLVQHPEDDTFYLNHDSTGSYYIGGALFTEHQYNGTDLTDPVSVVYGHRMKIDAMFGRMQAIYSSPEGMAEHSEVTVYLPDRELHFRVFAAVPYDSRHILYNYNFENRRMYNAFLDSIFAVREIGAVRDEHVQVTAQDRLLILSTCMQGNSQKRFLVLAKQV